MLSLLPLAQHVKAWPIFNTLDTEATGISFTYFSQLTCFQHTLIWPSEDCNSQNTCTGNLKKAVWKPPTFPTELAIVLVMQHTQRGMQRTRLLAPAGSALSWTARQHDSAPDSYQVQLTDQGSWQHLEYEENDITSMKTKQLRKRTKDLTSSEKKNKNKSSSLSTIKWDGKRVRSHYQPNLTQAELQTKQGYVEVPQKSSKPTCETQERE